MNDATSVAQPASAQAPGKNGRLEFWLMLVIACVPLFWLIDLYAFTAQTTLRQGEWPDLRTNPNDVGFPWQRWRFETGLWGSIIGPASSCLWALIRLPKQRRSPLWIVLALAIASFVITWTCIVVDPSGRLNWLFD